MAGPGSTGALRSDGKSKGALSSSTRAAGPSSYRTLGRLVCRSQPRTNRTGQPQSDGRARA
eukprot:1309900-Alexandrium_andersonii.AAC.1